MTKQQRADFKEAAAAVVVKKKRPDGTVAVPGTYKLAWVSTWLEQAAMIWVALAHSGRGCEANLKKTQEYPRGFARAVARLHLQDAGSNSEALVMVHVGSCHYK